MSDHDRATTAGPVPDDGEGHAPMLRRRCGRCRAEFPVEPGLDVRSSHEWWACPECRIALFQRTTRP